MKRFNILFLVVFAPLYLTAGCCTGKDYCLISCAPGSGCCCCDGGCCCDDGSCCSKEDISSVECKSDAKNPVQEFASKTAVDQAIKNHAVVVIDFHATWCGPCGQQDPILRAIADKYQDIYFIKLNIDESENRALSNAYGIERIPTLLFFKNGIIKKCVVGIQQEAQLKTILDDILK